jgi:TldD protein
MNTQSNATLNFFQSRFGVDQNIMNNLLDVALSRGGDFAELYFEHRQSNSMMYEEQVVREASSGVTNGVGIRVVSGDSIGYAYSEDFNIENMRHAAITAAQISQSGQASSPINASIQDLPNLYQVEKPTVDVRALEKLEIIKRADLAARAYSPHINKVVVNFLDELKRVVIATSDGRLAADAQPLMRLVVSVIAQRDGRRESGRSASGGRYGMDYFSTVRSPEDIAKDAARQAVTMLDSVEAPAGMLPVVLAAGWSGVLLHEAVGHGLEADFNFKKLSNFTDRVGQQVASPLCTIVDDGTIEHSRGSLNMDDEGNPTKYNVLIENGILSGYMQDRISSKHFDNQITGNGRRQSFRHHVMPRMTNTYMLNGESTFDELIQAVPRGLYCVDYAGGQVNITNGDFVFSVTEAYLIENGQVTKPVKGINLIGNGPEVLNKVTKVANDFRLAYDGGTCGKNGQGVPVSLGMPSVLVSSITVGGTAS